jgi:hypothetical protein
MYERNRKTSRQQVPSVISACIIVAMALFGSLLNKREVRLICSVFLARTSGVDCSATIQSTAVIVLLLFVRLINPKSLQFLYFSLSMTNCWLDDANQSCHLRRSALVFFFFSVTIIFLVTIVKAILVLNWLLRAFLVPSRSTVVFASFAVPIAAYQSMLVTDRITRAKVTLNKQLCYLADASSSSNVFSY